jgi:hypothetical protein
MYMKKEEGRDETYDNKTRDTWTMMMNLWEPLLFHVFERCGGCHRETNEKDVSLRVG